MTEELRIAYLGKHLILILQVKELLTMHTKSYENSILQVKKIQTLVLEMSKGDQGEGATEEPK